MNSLWIILLAIFLFLFSYENYGEYICEKWGINFRRPTPVHRRYLKPIYFPYKSKELVKNHIVSTVCIGAIIGPVIASSYGWLPIYIWIIVGAIFIGCINDFGVLFISIRNDGKTTGDILNEYTGKRGHISFTIIAWILSMLTLSICMSVIKEIFEKSPSTVEAVIIFVLISLIYGFVSNRWNRKKGIAMLISIILIFSFVYVSYKFPFINIASNLWQFVILAAILIYSFLPYWISCEPKDNLSFFMIVCLIIIGVVGIIIYRPYFIVQSYNFNANLDGIWGWMFPIMFIAVSFGAVSGFHTFVCSGITSRQIDSEKDAKCVSWVGMFTEAIIAVIAIIYSSCTIKSNSSVIDTFVNSIIQVIIKFQPIEGLVKTLIYMIIVIIALNGVDIALSLGSYMIEDFSEIILSPKVNFITGKISTIITLFISWFLMAYSYKKLWLLTGTANTMIGAMGLFTVVIWLKKAGKNNITALIPMIFLCITSSLGMIILSINYFISKEFTLLFISLSILCAFLFFIGTIIRIIKINNKSVLFQKTSI